MLAKVVESLNEVSEFGIAFQDEPGLNVLSECFSFLFVPHTVSPNSGQTNPRLCHEHEGGLEILEAVHEPRPAHERPGGPGLVL